MLALQVMHGSPLEKLGVPSSFGAKAPSNAKPLMVEGLRAFLISVSKSGELRCEDIKLLQ